jgi:hypothetical protein
MRERLFHKARRTPKLSGRFGRHSNAIRMAHNRSHLESRQLASGTINLRLGAVRRLAYEAADCGLLSADLAAGIRRVNPSSSRNRQETA